MQRREVLGTLGAAVALTGLAPETLRALGRPGARRVPQQPFFTPDQRETIATIAELIIPATDTPGAREAGVAAFVETIVAEWMSPEERARFLAGLADSDDRARTLAGAPFVQAGAAVQAAILAGMETEGRVLRERDPRAPMPFFARMKGLTLHGYFTSEIGMTRELRHHPFPGRYDGCLDLAPVPAPGGGA